MTFIYLFVCLSVCLFVCSFIYHLRQSDYALVGASLLVSKITQTIYSAFDTEETVRF